MHSLLQEGSDDVLPRPDSAPASDRPPSPQRLASPTASLRSMGHPHGATSRRRASSVASTRSDGLGDTTSPKRRTWGPNAVPVGGFPDLDSSDSKPPRAVATRVAPSPGDDDDIELDVSPDKLRCAPPSLPSYLPASLPPCLAPSVLPFRSSHAHTDPHRSPPSQNGGNLRECHVRAARTPIRLRPRRARTPSPPQPHTMHWPPPIMAHAL